MDEDPVDFSSIDPARDPARWDAIVASVAARARARRRRTFAQELVRRGVPAFALAAAAAAAVWLAKPRPSPSPEPVAPAASRAPADVIAGWAYGDADPTALFALGGGDAGR